MSNEFSYLSDGDLVDIILVYHYRNSEEYQQLLLNELKRRDVDINLFNDDESYIKSFINCFPDGWSDEIRKMFDELLLGGWNKSMHIQAKEKWGYFHFSGGNLSENMHDIIDKHREFIDNTCSRCGNKDHVQGNGGSWIEILCRECAQKDLAFNGIYNISDKSFTYRNVKSDSTDFLWDEVVNVNLEFSENNQSIELEFNRIVESYYGFDDYVLNFGFLSNLNFIKLLETIPDYLLSADDAVCRTEFLNELKNCHFCDKKAVYKNSCRLCRESLDDDLSQSRNQYLKFYNNIPALMKETREKSQYYINFSNELNFFYHKDYFPE
ncbi:hypothetical protein [Chryseobacterium sp. GP-SGM7]|uniref:hypothetical protein n=1 Tax=Chryseobacterium sp. GP-SGM7 TaxID=3411323 RepID=UPI003B937ADF